MRVRKASFFSLAILLTGTSALGVVSLQARPVPQQAQNTPSVAEAARKAREQKKIETKPVKVFTDDDVANLKGSVSIVGATPAPPAKPGDATAAPAAPKPDEAAWRQKFVGARKTLADDSKELDILQREFNLKQQQYYSNPNIALSEQNSRKDLDDTQAQIDAKKTAVDKDNQAISDLEDALRQAGGDPGWSREP